MGNARSQSHAPPSNGERPLGVFACPNPDGEAFNRFGGDNLSVAEHMGKDKAIRRLYCRRCKPRFSEHQGSLMEYSKVPLPAVVRIVKCLGHGCSVEATADICEVDARFSARPHSGHGPGPGRSCLECSGICVSPGPRQRPPTSGLGRPAQQSFGIGLRRL